VLADIFLRKLTAIATGRRSTTRLVQPGEHPPCFNSLGEYVAWLDACDLAGIGPPVPRKDFSAEPNYCIDCRPEYKLQMERERRCLFPEIEFRSQGSKDERELVGLSPREAPSQ